MGFYEREKEVLAVADHCRVALAGNPDCTDPGLSRGAFCIHVVLRQGG